MGRSVNVPSGAEAVVFIDVSEYDEFGWEDSIEDVQHVLQDRYPSFDLSDAWFGREEKAILENCHAHVVVSEYGGLASISLVPRDSGYGRTEDNLAEAWCGQIAKGFSDTLNKTFNGLQKLGTASNGESFYRRISA